MHRFLKTNAYALSLGLILHMGSNSQKSPVLHQGLESHVRHLRLAATNSFLATVKFVASRNGFGALGVITGMESE